MSGPDALFFTFFGACMFTGTLLWVKRKLGL